MAIETELKLSLPASALPKLRQHRLLTGTKPQRQRLLNTYYDTLDLALKQRRIALRHRTLSWGQLLTVKSAEPAAGGLAQRSEWEAPSEPGAFNFSHVDDKPLRKWLEALVPNLQPVFTTDFLRTTWLISPTPGTQIEVALDRGAVRCGEREDPICEIELELLEGPTSSLFDLALALQADLPLRPEIASKAERGFSLFLQAGVKPVRARASSVEKGLTSGQAFRAIALQCIEQLQRNEGGVRNSEDQEFVHQARVAIRRLRTAMRFWAPLLPPGFVTTLDPAWRELAQALGNVRNRDVFAAHTLPPLVASFPEHSALRQLAALAERQRVQSRRELMKLLAKPDFGQLVLRTTAAIHAIPDFIGLESLEEFSRRRLRRLARDVFRKAMFVQHDPEAHHRLRIAFKRLRYALEFMAPLYPRKAVRRHVAAAGEIQELLGAMNDIAVAGSLIAEHRRLGHDDLLRGWLVGREVLFRELLPTALEIFQQTASPWKRRGEKAS
jgi:inorganic triphosphatase YgiF